MTRQALLERISNIESELQELKLEAYLELIPRQTRLPQKLSEISSKISLPKLTFFQIQKEIEAYRKTR